MRTAAETDTAGGRVAEEGPVKHDLGMITALRDDDLPFLWELLSAASHDAGLLPASTTGPTTVADVQRTPFGAYLAGWGRVGDAGVVAWDTKGCHIGAAWYRLFPPAHPGYGFVAPDVPELSIRVLAEARGHGVGDSLLRRLCQRAQQEGYPAVSLSVARRNPAQHLYARHGFEDAYLAAPTDSSVTLLKTLVVPSPSQEGGAEHTP
jgi:ribosomal protein S18 acetylase RimI-like enzyme